MLVQDWQETCSTPFRSFRSPCAKRRPGGIEKLSHIPSSQKLFTEDEVSRVTGICLEHLRNLAQMKHLGSIVRAAEAASVEAEKWLFTNSELMILNVLCPRCDH